MTFLLLVEMGCTAFQNAYVTLEALLVSRLVHSLTYGVQRMNQTGHQDSFPWFRSESKTGRFHYAPEVRIIRITGQLAQYRFPL
ncbi:hypothetical protein ACFOZ5_04760 [Marinobacter lacisalsi]|uniref:Secreted protein n=1 Tax=Marinobacter lacisalsi TaxID=475979 RepID=A0ABV8QDH8_9GAMM